MIIKIETYRGWEIVFDNNKEVFSTQTIDYGKESKSYAAIKKYIDDFIKDNNSFEPFQVIKKPNRGNKCTVLKIVGIRKDGLFVNENSKGEKEVISKCDIEDFVIYNPIEHDKIFARIAVLNLEEDKITEKLSSVRKEFKGVELSEIHSQYLPK